QEAGLTQAHFEAIPHGASAPVWTEHERLLIEVTDELIERHTLSDARWAALTVVYDPPELLELLFTVGSYLCMALVVNSVDLAPDVASSDPVPPPVNEGD